MLFESLKAVDHGRIGHYAQTDCRFRKEILEVVYEGDSFEHRQDLVNETQCEWGRGRENRIDVPNG